MSAGRLKVERLNCGVITLISKINYTNVVKHMC
jgi:hypothetical protein